MCFIDNVVDANMLALNSDKSFRGECYNICSGLNISNSEILKFMMSRFPGIEVVRAPRRAGDIMKSLGDFSAAKRDLGYLPKVTFWDGLEKTLNWWNLK